MKKGTIMERVHITTLGYGGVGIAQATNGKKILVKGALPDSLVDVKVVKKRRDYIQAHIVHVHEVDAKRIDGKVACPHYLFSYGSPSGVPEGKQGCGGCKWQIMSYDRQLELKQGLLYDCFSQVLTSTGASLLPLLPSPEQFGYRNKIEFSFGKYLVKDRSEEAMAKDSPQFTTAEHWQLGFHKQGEFSKIVDVDQCYLVSERTHKVYAYVKAALLASGLPVHDSKTHRGLLRHLVLREGVGTGHIMMNISYAAKHFAEHQSHKKIWEDLLVSRKQDAFLQEYVTTCVLIENNGLADTVKGPDVICTTLRGEGRIFEVLTVGDATLRFQISPFSFFQTNTKGAELLFTTAAQTLGNVQGNIIDLYCGSGTIGLSFIAQGVGQQVQGIEVVPSAVYDAEHNARINNLSDRSTFHVGRAEKLLLDETIDHHFMIGGDAIILDPPREGLHPHVVDFLISLKKKYSYKLLYISCNPVTMARDIQGLLAGGFSLTSLQGVDMFPHTHHVETIGLLHT